MLYQLFKSNRCYHLRTWQFAVRVEVPDLRPVSKLGQGKQGQMPIRIGRMPQKVNILHNT